MVALDVANAASFLFSHPEPGKDEKTHKEREKKVSNIWNSPHMVCTAQSETGANISMLHTRHRIWDI